MAMSNPTMDAISRGGAVANQGMSVANSMMQGVQRAMDSTSDLTYKLTNLLKTEEARKFNQGMAITKSLQDQFQFDIQQKWRDDQLAETKRRNAADEAIKGANFLMNSERNNKLNKLTDLKIDEYNKITKPLNELKLKTMEKMNTPSTLSDIKPPEPPTKEGYEARMDMYDDKWWESYDKLNEQYDSGEIDTETFRTKEQQMLDLDDIAYSAIADQMGAEFDTKYAQYEDDLKSEQLRSLRNTKGLASGFGIPFSQEGTLKQLETYELNKANSAKAITDLWNKIPATIDVVDKYGNKQKTLNNLFTARLASATGVSPSAIQQMFNGNISKAASQNKSLVENEIGYIDKGNLVPEGDGYVIDYNKVSNSKIIPESNKYGIFSKGFKDFGTMSNTQRSQFTKGVKENPEYSARAMVVEFT